MKNGLIDNELKKGFGRRKAKIDSKKGFYSRKEETAIESMTIAIGELSKIGYDITVSLDSNKYSDNEYLLCAEYEKDVKAILFTTDGYFVFIPKVDGELTGILYGTLEETEKLKADVIKEHKVDTLLKKNLLVIIKVNDFLEERLESIDESIEAYGNLIKIEMEQENIQNKGRGDGN